MSRANTGSAAMPGVLRPVPAIEQFDAPFWEACNDGRLTVQQCNECSTFIHPPLPRCKKCLSERLEFRTLSGSGMVLTFTVNYHVWQAGWEAPYIVSVVQPLEAPNVRFVGELLECVPEGVSIGMPVRTVFIEARDGFKIPAFVPAGEGGAVQ